VPRKEEKPSLGKRLTEWVMAAGALVLVGGLVTAFLVVGIWGLHRSLSRNEDENLVAREDAPKKPVAPKPSPLDELKKPLAPAPAADPRNVSVAPAPAPKRVPEGPPSKDPSRMDAEGFVRYWLVLGPLPADKEMDGAAEVAREKVPGEAGLRPKADEAVKVKGKEYSWQRHKTTDSFIDFRKLFEGKRQDDATAYAIAYLGCDEELKNVKLLVGSNDQCRVYLNGQQVQQWAKSRTMERDQNIVDGLTLKKGQNVVVLKVVNEKNAWQGCLRFMTAEGVPIRHLQLTSTPQ
jgi:hypothetical protein